MTRKAPKKTDRPGKDRLGRTPLHYAACDNKLSEVKDLIASGADVDAQDDNGWVPLHFAAQANSPEIIEALLHAGATINRQDSYGNTPLFRAVFSYSGDSRPISILRRNGADPRIENLSGISALQLARDSYSEATKNEPCSRLFEDIID